MSGLWLLGIQEKKPGPTRSNGQPQSETEQCLHHSLEPSMSPATFRVQPGHTSADAERWDQGRWRGGVASRNLDLIVNLSPALTQNPVLWGLEDTC